jgi:D-amino-acid dehydrogenase
VTRSVAVVGAGLAGVTTAYELAALGCRVQVFERGGSVAEQASFASNALLSPFLPDLDDGRAPAPLAWRWRRWRAGRSGGDAASVLTALSQLGLARTAELRRDLGLDDEAPTACSSRWPTPGALRRQKPGSKPGRLWACASSCSKPTRHAGANPA